MNTLGFGRRTFGMGLAMVMLGGCGGTQGHGVGMTPQGTMATTEARAQKASGSYGDLIYVATSNAIVVLSYPQLKVVQSLPSPILTAVFVPTQTTETSTLRRAPRWSSTHTGVPLRSRH